MSLSLYILRLVHGKYYVGVSADLSIELAIHESGQVPWTKLYPVQEMLMEDIPVNELTADHMTELLMLAHGIENVRGGMYSDITLEPFLVSYLNMKFQHIDDDNAPVEKSPNFCTICGNAYHPHCRAKITRTGAKIKNKNPIFCGRCCRYGHTTDECFCVVDIDGNHI